MPLSCAPAVALPFRPALALAVALLLTPASARAADRDPWWGPDKALHLGVSAALAAGLYGVGAAALEPPWARALFGGGLALAAGAAKELWDLRAGDPSWRDFTWDVVGVTLGLVVALTVDLLFGAGRGEAASASRGAVP